MIHHATSLAPALPVQAGHNRPPGADLDEIVNAITDILVQDRSKDLPCHIATAFQKANPHKTLERTLPDPILTDLLGFEEHMLPEMNNLFCADIGTLLEKMMKALFKLTRGDTVDVTAESMADLKADYLRGKNRNLKWKDADFFLGRDQIVEVKYRFNSYQSKPEQINAARIYIEMGLKPVFLHLSSDFKHKKDFEDAGWEVHYGPDAVSYISDHTGHDFEAILARVAAQPVVAQKVREGHADMMKRLKAEATRDILYGPEEVRTHMLWTIATDQVLLRRFDRDFLQGDLDEPEARDALEQRVEALSDMAIDDMAPNHCARQTYEKLSLADKKEHLVAALAALSEDDRLDILERI